MATDRSLATLLRALQVSSGDLDASRLIQSASLLLNGLTNPLNITLLTNQILTAPAIWLNAKSLHTPLQVLSAFTSATSQYQTEQPHGSPSDHNILSREIWVMAVTEGIHNLSPKWKHLLVYCGLLLGFEKDNRKSGLGVGVRHIEMTLVHLINFILSNETEQNWWSMHVISLTVGSIFNSLSKEAKVRLDHDLLLPLITKSTLFSDAALNHGYFLSTIDIDIVQDEGNKFCWRPNSLTYVQVRHLSNSPLVRLLGPLSQVVRFSIATIEETEVLDVFTLDLLTFSKSLDVQWRQNKLAEIDVREEDQFLVGETRSQTLPVLWRLLQTVGFAIVVMLRSLVETLLTISITPQNKVLTVATRVLHTLRCLHFIVARLGHNSSSSYVFIYTTCIDILSSFPVEIEKLLYEMQPAELGRIPEHPQERCYDLFFLNLAEPFSLALPPSICEKLFIAAAVPYLERQNDIRLLGLLEAAHSMFLAVLVAPQCSHLIPKYLSYYLVRLFQAFPHTLSSQQLRIAVRILAQSDITVSPTSGVQSPLASVIMDILQQRFESTSYEPSSAALKQNNGDDNTSPSERALLLLAMIDILPFLNEDELEAALSQALSNLRVIRNFDDLRSCRDRLWEVMNDGEMDFKRAAIGVQWWNTKGGRRSMILLDHIQNSDEYIMHGAIAGPEKL